MSYHDGRKIPHGSTGASSGPGNTNLSGSPSSGSTMKDYIGNSAGSRRSSGNFARLAFSIYGGSSGVGTGNSGTASSISPSFHHHHRLSVNAVQFYAPAEILCVGKSHDSSNILAVGGQKMLQLLKVVGNEVVVESDIFSSSRNTKFGSASDVKFGHAQFNKVFAAATISGSIYTYNVQRGFKAQGLLNEHSRAVNSIDFNVQNPCNLVSGSQDGTMKIWDLRSKGNRAAVTIYGISDAVRCVQFSPHNARKVAGIFDSGVIKMWDMRNPNQYEKRMTAHTGPGLSLDWHPEYDYILSGGRDKQLQVWNMAATDSREPNYVISTSGAISKASWCPYETSSLLSTDIAISFLNDDPCVQVWNLSRKYIPKQTVESHSNQVTGLVWASADSIWSCSRDRMLVLDDLKTFPRPLDNVPPAVVGWNSSSGTELCFVQQNKYQFEKTLAVPAARPAANSVVSSSETIGRYQQSQQLVASPTNSNHAQLSPTGSLHAQSTQTSASTSPWSMSSTNIADMKFTPVMARSQSYRPQLNRTPSQIPPASSDTEIQTQSPYMCPVNLPLRDSSPEVFEFLASHYLISVPDGMDIVSLCEYNASIAASARKFRDCQTWRTIKASILWQMSEEENGNTVMENTHDPAFYEEHVNEQKRMPIPRGSMMTVDSRSSFDTALGSAPSDHFGIGSSPGNVFAKSFKAGLANLEMAKARTYSGLSMQSSPESRSNLTERFEKLRMTEASKASKVENAADLDNENAISDGEEPNESEQKQPVQIPPSMENVERDHDPETKAIPIGKSPNKSVKSGNGSGNRYTFRGEVAPDFDNEKPPSPNFSSKSPYSLRSSLSSSMRKVDTKLQGNTSLLVQPLLKTSRAASRISGRSELTEMLKSVKSEQTEKDLGEFHLNVPWSPNRMIQQASDYSAQQGDIIMSATLALLFAKKYGGIRYRTAEDWVYSYHEILCRRTLFGVAANVMKVASDLFDSLKQKGQTDVSLRTFCGNCGSLILNENTKNRLQTDPEIEFGFWYCDRCNKSLGGCIYCHEAVKGMAVCLLECGHRGHFGCLKRWFFEEGETDCPAGCGFVALR
ncbi:unnamed protein product [Kuraishia capsulata CBS 1993]|uniref:Restriction of telomere capping protein 1 n=1 Tax=Kuraishia capsulata CBS 1993 TaxID=1382522 RepID=W6MI84_9ASCO|nr:uncharacterized protein KUCA_T00002110001 [Kuraishia capsulata CBS 1993]CDK26139.1 unnamed protein product [Kuraishia capsulata CBS 1993]